MLPDLSGFELARILRHGGKTPIIILSARGEKADKLTGLRLGADDYITKPFDMEELVARINTVLRRVKPTIASIRLAGITIDFRSSTATGPRGDLHLTHREFEILRVLAERVPASCFVMSSSGKCGAFSTRARPARSTGRSRGCDKRSKWIRERRVFAAPSTATATS